MSLIGSSCFGTHRCPSRCYIPCCCNRPQSLLLSYSRPSRDCPTLMHHYRGSPLLCESGPLHSHATCYRTNMGVRTPVGSGCCSLGCLVGSCHSFRGLFPL
ncbi:hypothetical protein BGW80DRAFT_1286823, partial [Lactifluus volemus]